MSSLLGCAPEPWTSDVGHLFDICLPFLALCSLLPRLHSAQTTGFLSMHKSNLYATLIGSLWPYTTQIGSLWPRPLWLGPSLSTAISPFWRLRGLWLGLFCSPGPNGNLTHGEHVEIDLFLAALASHLVQTPSEKGMVYRLKYKSNKEG